MKKIFLSGIMSVLLLVGFISMVSMAPPPPPLNSTFCKAFAKENAALLEEFGISKGEFFSTCNVCLNKSESAGNDAVCICKIFLLKGGDLADEGHANFGQCVNFVKANQ